MWACPMPLEDQPSPATVLTVKTLTNDREVKAKLSQVHLSSAIVITVPWATPGHQGDTWLLRSSTPLLTSPLPLMRPWPVLQP